MKIQIDVALAMCNILDEYVLFKKRIDELSDNFNDYSKLDKFKRISNGDNPFGSFRLKKFYQDNQRTIGKITQYTSIDRFIEFVNKQFHYNYFYEYLVKHKDKLQTIISVLNKLQSLGFTELKFEEYEDFTKEKYQMSPWIILNRYVNFTENMQLIPNPDGNSIICYQSTGTNYVISLYTYFCKDLEGCARSIKVNNLTFDPELLPNSITEESILEPIFNLENQTESIMSSRRKVN